MDTLMTHGPADRGSPRLEVGIDLRVADCPESGQQRYLWRLGRWLAERGDAVHFLTVRRQPEGIECPSGARLHRLDRASRSVLRDHVRDLELDALLLNPERSRRYRGLPANVLRPGYGTDHYRQKLRSFRTLLAAVGRRALRVTPWELAERRWERRFYEAGDPAPEVVAVSDYMGKEIRDTYAVPEDHVHVIHNGVDLDEFSVSHRAQHRDEQRSLWGIPRDALCLLVVGHNFRLKGLWEVLRAMDDVRRMGAPEIHLLVAGRGTGAAQRWLADRMVTRSGLAGRVHRVGWVRPSYLAYAAADALIHLSWHDSFGFVTLEAMAMGLPVLTTPYVGAAELIDDESNGLIVDPVRPDEVVRRVRELGDPELRERLGAAAARTAADHPEARSFQRVRKVLLLARERGGEPVR